MNKINKLLIIMLSVFLICTPCYVSAENEENTTNPGETSGETTEGENNEVTPSPSPEPEVTYEIKLDYSELSLDIGKNTTLNATVTPTDAKIIWSSSDENIAKVDSNGNVTAGSTVGKATITAKIDGTNAQATCIVSVTRNQGTDATLKSLTITNGTLDKDFKSDVFKYTVTIGSDVSELEIEYELSDKNAKLGFINGNSNLEDGDTVTILINAENHTADKPNQQAYELKIVKEAVSLNLKKLELNGYSLNEVFDPDTQTYTANIPYEIEIVTVNAKAESDDVTITVSGNKNLIVGQNVVKVEVKDKNGNSKVYKIVVIRDKETSVEENPTSIITSSMINDNNSDSKNDTTSGNSSDNELFKYIIVSIACLILFAIGGIGIYFYIKTSPKKLKKELIKEKSSPITEVKENDENVISDNKTTNSNSNIESMMETKLVETREFQVEELNDIKTENLFDDGEDV